MKTSWKDPPPARRLVVESVLGLDLNKILELGLRIATGLLITLAAGLVLLAVEVRFGVPPETLNYFRFLATAEAPAMPAIQGLE